MFRYLKRAMWCASLLAVSLIISLVASCSSPAPDREDSFETVCESQREVADEWGNIREQTGDAGDQDGRDGEDSEHRPPEAIIDHRPTSKTFAQLRLDPQAPILPFPCDLLLTQDQTSATGLRPQLTETNSPSIDYGLRLFGSVYRDLINALDGWSIYAPIFIPTSRPVDLSGLPQDPAAARTYKGQALFLLNAQPKDPDYGKRIDIAVQSFSEEIDEGEWHFLKLRPVIPLNSRTRYLVVVTDQLKDQEGLPVAADRDFALLRDGDISGHPHRDRLEKMSQQLSDVWPMLSHHQVERRDIALAFTFTTGDPRRLLLAARDVLYADPKLSNPQLEFDRDASGKIALCDPPPQCSLPNLAPRDQILAILTGSVISPDFRATDKTWVVQNGQPVVQSYEKLRFWLSIPKQITQKPVGIAILQHGLNSRKEQTFVMANALAQRGIAAIAIDAVGHGSRSGGVGSAGFEFINFLNPKPIVDNFRQTIIDQIQVLRTIKALNKLDLYPFDQADGKPDFSTERLAYLGISLGGIIGGSTVSIEPAFDAAALIVSGGGFTDLIRIPLNDKFRIKSPLIVEQFSHIVQLLLDAADPLSYASTLATRTTRSPDILMQMVIDDDTVPNQSSVNKALVLDLPLLKPVFRDISGLTIADTPAYKRGLVQYNGPDHNFFSGLSDLARTAHQQAAHFLSSALESGSGEILQPQKP